MGTGCCSKISLSPFILSSCAGPQVLPRKRTANRVKTSMREVVAMKEKRKAYERKLDAQLDEWSAQINVLKAKADKAKAEVKIEYYKTIEVLERKQKDARAKLQELKTAGDEAWEDLKTGAEKAWAEVKNAYHDARSRFK